MIDATRGRFGFFWPPVTWIVGREKSVTIRLAHGGAWHGGTALPPNDFYYRHVLVLPSGRADSRAGPDPAPGTGGGQGGTITDGTSNTIVLGETGGGATGPRARNPGARSPKSADGISLSFDTGGGGKSSASRGKTGAGGGTLLNLSAGRIGTRPTAGPATVRDGTSNTLVLGERAPAGSSGRPGAPGIIDGSSNTILIGEAPGAGGGSARDDGTAKLVRGERARRWLVACRLIAAIYAGTSSLVPRDPAGGGTITDGTSNTILLGEAPVAGRGPRRTGGSARVTDGTSNTLQFAERSGTRPGGSTGITDGTSNTLQVAERTGTRPSGSTGTTDGTSNTLQVAERTDRPPGAGRPGPCGAHAPGGGPIILLSGRVARGPAGAATIPVTREHAAACIAEALLGAAGRDAPGRLRHVRVPVEFGRACVGAGGRALSRVTIHAWHCGGGLFDVFHCETEC